MPRKEVRFSYGNLRISRLENFENRSTSSGEGLVQIKPNLACDFSSAYKIFFCLQGDDANKENLVQTEMMPTMPKSARFFGFQCKFENLAEAKQKLKNLYPDAASIVFLSSRPNQTWLNGWINFTKEIQCEKFMREIRQNPPKNGLRLKKPGKPIAIERPALIQKGPGSGVLYNEWFSKKHPNFSAEVNVSEIEKNRESRILKF